MRRRKLFAILVVAMLLFTAIAVSSVFCDEEPGGNNFEEFSGEDGSGGGDPEPCGGGDLPGPGPPQ